MAVDRAVVAEAAHVVVEDQEAVDQVQEAQKSRLQVHTIDLITTDEVDITVITQLIAISVNSLAGTLEP
jgi:hypothetical protein